MQREGKILFRLPVITEVSQGRSPETGTRAEATEEEAVEECRLLVFLSLTFDYLSCYHFNHLPRDGTAHRKLPSPTSLIEKKIAPKTCFRSMIESSLPLKLPLPE